MEFAEDYGFEAAQIQILEQTGRCAEAASLHLEAGRRFEAITYLLKDKSRDDSMFQAKTCILEGLWELFPFSGREPDVVAEEHVQKLFQLLLKLDPGILEPMDRHEVGCRLIILIPALQCCCYVDSDVRSHREERH